MVENPVAFEIELTRNEAVAIGVSNVQVSYGGNWKVRHFKNVTVAPNTTIISLTLAPKPAVAGVGVVLYPGDSCTDSVSEGYAPYKGPVNGIGSDANGLLAIFER